MNELNKQISKLQKQLNPLLDKRTKIREELALEKNKKLIGKCFRYRNGLSGESWWMYIKVIDIVQSYRFIIFTVEVSNRFIEIKKEQTSSWFLKCSKEISAREFKKQFNRILNKIKE